MIRLAAKYYPDGDVWPVVSPDICIAELNRQNWVIISEIIELE